MLAPARRRLRAGNLYLNRKITGAVVGRQPFGGFRLSGIGSKAGGPDYLLQFCDPRRHREHHAPRLRRRPARHLSAGTAARGRRRLRADGVRAAATVTDGVTGTFRGAWRHRRWRWLLGSYAVSLTGDFLYFVALIVFLMEATDSATWVAVSAIIRVLVYVILSPFGGAVADRYDRRRLMVVLDVARAGVMALIAVVVWSDGPPAVVVALTVVTRSSQCPIARRRSRRRPHSCPRTISPRRTPPRA